MDLLDYYDEVCKTAGLIEDDYEDEKIAAVIATCEQFDLDGIAFNYEDEKIAAALEIVDGFEKEAAKASPGFFSKALGYIDGAANTTASKNGIMAMKSKTAKAAAKKAKENVKYLGKHGDGSKQMERTIARDLGTFNRGGLSKAKAKGYIAAQKSIRNRRIGAGAAGAGLLGAAGAGTYAATR